MKELTFTSESQSHRQGLDGLTYRPPESAGDIAASQQQQQRNDDSPENGPSNTRQRTLLWNRRYEAAY